ncbi:ABC transporter permease, partial [Longimicrobium sp.]|uniref:ABC transporter permease n=1 Tax=Longimicrobium sp. TaxID=2029185 RepID=UPI002E310BCE
FLSGRRVLLMVALAALPVLLALRQGGTEPKVIVEGFAKLYQMLILGVLLPIVGLILGTSVFGAEVDDGTITYVLGKPVARWRIVLTRIVAAGAATAAVLVPSTLAAALVGLRGANAPGVAWACTAAVAIGSFLYAALFVAFSLSTRRALVAGLAYVVLWEGSLSNTFGGSRALSIRQYTMSFAEWMAGTSGEAINARLEPGVALAMAATVAVLATLYAIRRLRRFEIGEAV